MAWMSILPAQLGYVETGISWLFICLGLLTLGPWLLVFLYDATLYTWRRTTHRIPLIGGAAQGKLRPRAPSLARRPDGHRRRFSLAFTSVDLKDLAGLGTSPRRDGDDSVSRGGRRDGLVVQKVRRDGEGKGWRFDGAGEEEQDEMDELDAAEDQDDDDGVERNDSVIEDMPVEDKQGDSPATGVDGGMVEVRA